MWKYAHAHPYPRNLPLSPFFVWLKAPPLNVRSKFKYVILISVAGCFKNPNVLFAVTNLKEGDTRPQEDQDRGARKITPNEMDWCAIFVSQCALTQNFRIPKDVFLPS